jgi:hypothetical protein
VSFNTAISLESSFCRVAPFPDLLALLTDPMFALVLLRWKYFCCLFQAFFKLVVSLLRCALLIERRQQAEAVSYCDVVQLLELRIVSE